MRKSAWIAVIVMVIILAAFFVVAPAIIGFCFQRGYTKFIASVNSPDHIQIRVLTYQRSWFHSDVTIELTMNDPSYFKVIQGIGLPLGEIPKQYRMTQHIAHGPMMYDPVNGMRTLVGIATITNELVLTPSVKHFLVRIGANPDAPFILTNRDFIGWQGAIYKYLKINATNTHYPPNTRIHIKQAGTEARLWIYPTEKRVTGDWVVHQVNVKDHDSSIVLPDIVLHFNVYRSPSQLWLGNTRLQLSDMTWVDDGVRVFSMSGLDFSGTIDEVDGLISGSRSFTIEKMNINGRSLGPMQLQLSVNQIKAQALVDLLDSYRQITLRGELYQSQLQKKMYAMLPALITPNTQLALSKLKIDTQYGHLDMKGELRWAIDQSAMPDDLIELIQSADGYLDLRFAKRLGEEIIAVASTLPFFNSVGPSLSEIYWDLRQQLYFSERQNAFTLAGLVDTNLISEGEALNLLQLQRRGVSYDQYANQVKKLFLEKEITRETSYALDWQYQQVVAPANEIKNLAANNQAAVARDMHEQLDEWIKTGIVKSVNDEYVISVIQHQGDYKINGKAL